MSADLGTWSPSQARTVVRVLEQRGLQVHTEHDAGQVRILVDGDTDVAHRALVEAMDEIAGAADRRQIRVEAPARPARRSDDEDGPPLVFERLRNAAPVIAVVVAGLLVVLVVPGTLKLPSLLLTLAVIGLVAWRTGGDDDHRYGPGA